VANVRSTSGLALEDFGTNGKEKNGLINAAASSTILLLFYRPPPPGGTACLT